MPREHSRITMTPDELDTFLGSFERLILATTTADGDPWGDAAAYVYADGRIWFRIGANSRSAEHIARDPRVCCVVESHPTGSTYYDIKGAIAHGAAQPMGDDGPAAVREALAGIADPVDPSGPRDGLVFSIDLSDSTSFSFDKIQYRYQDKRLGEGRVLT